MNIELSALAPLAASLARASLPTLSAILSDAAPFPFNLFVRPAFAAITSALGVDPAAPDAATQVQRKIDAAPAEAAAKLQAVESEHDLAIRSAQDELDSRLKDVQDARATEVQYVQAGSLIAWGAPIVSILAVIGFFAVAILAELGYGNGQSGQWVVGAAISGWTAVLSYWIGSSKGSADKTDALTQIASTAAKGAASAGAASLVNANTAARKSGRA